MLPKLRILLHPYLVIFTRNSFIFRTLHFKYKTTFLKKAFFFTGGSKSRLFNLQGYSRDVFGDINEKCARNPVVLSCETSKPPNASTSQS